MPPKPAAHGITGWFPPRHATLSCPQWNPLQLRDRIVRPGPLPKFHRTWDIAENNPINCTVSSKIIATGGYRVELGAGVNSGEGVPAAAQRSTTCSSRQRVTLRLVAPAARDHRLDGVTGGEGLGEAAVDAEGGRW